MNIAASNADPNQNALYQSMAYVESKPAPYTTIPSDMLTVSDDPQEIKDFAQHMLDALPGYSSVFRVINNNTFQLVACNERARQSYAAMSYENQGIGKPLEDIMPANSAEKVRAAFRQCYEQNQTIFSEQLYGEGDRAKWVRSEYMPMYNRQGEITHIMTYWVDITQRKHQEFAEQEHQQQIIEQQALQLEELSTPLLTISDSTVIMPLIGAIDSRRIQQIMATLLEGINHNQATNVIVDITGVPLVDTQVANSLLLASHAVRLLGAEVILTGIRPEVAQTLIGLGVDLSTLRVAGTLRDGISIALKKDGVRIV